MAIPGSYTSPTPSPSPGVNPNGSNKYLELLKGAGNTSTSGTKVPGFPTSSADRKIFSGYGGGPGGSANSTITMTLGDYYNKFYAMTDAQVAALAQRLVQAGLIPNANQDRATIWQAWSAVINEAGSMSDANPTNRVTPYQRLASYMKNPLDAGGGQQPLKAYSTTNKAAVNFTDPAQARAMLTQSLTDSLGRAPTPAEQQAYMAALHSAEAAHPTITKTQYTPNATGTAYDTTSTNLSQQIDPGGYTSDYAKSHNKVEHASYQASTTYMNALMGALGATV